MIESIDDVIEPSGIDERNLHRMIQIALEEDLRYGPDVTSEATISFDQEAIGLVATRQPGIVCGVPVAIAVLAAVDFPLSGVSVLHHDGEAIESGDIVMQLAGPARPMLLAERTLLNFVTHLSGVASVTNSWVKALEGTNCKVRDTRKTTPGLRNLEKYAVRCGGGVNHRMGLGDAALIKDNHIAAAGGISAAIEAVRLAFPAISIEVECDTFDQVSEAIKARCSLILLDNMELDDIAKAVAAARLAPGVLVEASGGLTLDRASLVARAGVDYIAVGSITHSSVALDLGLDLDDVKKI